MSQTMRCVRLPQFSLARGGRRNLRGKRLNANAKKERHMTNMFSTALCGQAVAATRGMHRG